MSQAHARRQETVTGTGTSAKSPADIKIPAGDLARSAGAGETAFDVTSAELVSAAAAALAACR